MRPLVHTEILPWVDLALLSESVQGTYSEELLSKGVFFSTPPEKVVAAISKATVLYIHPDGFDRWTDLLLELQAARPLPVRLFIFADSDYAFGDEHLEALVHFFPSATFWIQNWCGSFSQVNLFPLGVVSARTLSHEKTCPLLISYVIPYTTNAKRIEFQQAIDASPSLLPYRSSRVPYDEYCRQLSMSYFSTCPMGEGFDTYRFWESLWMGAIPIVKRHPFYSGLREAYPNLPFLEVEEWTEVESLLPSLTPELHRNLLSSSDLSCLTLSYWKQALEEACSAEKV